MSKIRVGHRFFQRARSEYNDWRMATIRELSQNSQDAGATRIDITVSHIGDGKSLLSWKDNGNGMDRAVLENVFFALGETTKGGQDTGGFGKARELTCFSMEAYSIRTRHLLVDGMGDEYGITELSEFATGCSFDIHIDIEADYLASVIRSYFAYSNPLCEVYLNGKHLVAFADIGEHRRDLTFGSVFVNDQTEYHRCIIRVNGLCMFSRYIESSVAVYVNLDASRSRTLLTSNRDGLVGHDVNYELDRFMNEMAVDVKSAIRKRNGLKTGIIEGKAGVIRSVRKAKQEVNPLAVSGHMSWRAPVTKGMKSCFPELFRGNENFADDNRIDIFSVYVCDETQDEEKFSKMRASRDLFDPRLWRDAYTKNKDGTTRPYHIGGKRKKLLFYWKVACEMCIEILQDMDQIGDVSWSVGWLFADDRAACYVNEVDNHFYCLRPVGMDGKMLYSLTNEEHMHQLVWIALHEVAHTNFSYHNEDFANVLTTASSRVSMQMRSILGAMKAAGTSAKIH